MSQNLRRRAYLVSAVWTLVLLWLGSVVHATESSLACPDWPTCYGSWMPEMSGGIFWEHLHRLVAGGLLLMWGLATVLTFRETEAGDRTRGAAVAGMVLLMIQAVFGGLTVILELPDAISTSHLSMALIFLSLSTWLWVGTGPLPGFLRGVSDGDRRALKGWTLAAGVGVFAQSVLGAWVRHADAGMACPDVPLCRGQWIPTMTDSLVGIHFTHRVVGILVLVLVSAMAAAVVRRGAPPLLRRLAAASVGLVVVQVTLGFLSVWQVLAVTPVSLHTLVASLLLASLVVQRTALGAGEGATHRIRQEGTPAGLAEAAP